MKTYNSYEEAKIANPESEIVTTGKTWRFRDDLKGKFKALIKQGDGKQYLDNSAWVKCNPADHCMTAEKFLADGYKFVEGDIYLNSNGRTLGVVSIPEYNNKRSTIDCNLYILRAAALENIQTETQEEKEVLKGINGAGEIEWKNGDECLYMNSSYVCRFIGEDPTRNGFCYVKSNCSAVNWVEIKKLSKPETPQQREDRERLENGKAIYDLMCSIELNHDIAGAPNTWGELRDEWQSVYIKLAEEVGYRKEKTHGTN